MNKKMEVCAFIYDFKQQIMFDTNDIKIKILNNLAERIDIRNWAKEELKENAVTERAATAKTYYKSPEVYYDNPPSYFGNVKPIFKGANNGLK